MNIRKVKIKQVQRLEAKSKNQEKKRNKTKGKKETQL
jgi:hypothetical protein